MQIMVFLVVLIAGAAVGALVDNLLGIRYQDYKPYKWLIHVTTYIGMGIALAAAMPQ